MRSLPEDDQEIVLARLVERALDDPEAPSPGAASGRPGRPPQPSGELGGHPGPAPASVPTGVVLGLGAVAGEKLAREGGVGEVAALCSISEDEVRAAVRDASLGGGAPKPLLGYLALLSEGRTAAQARRRLKLTLRDLDALRRDPATPKLDIRLGRSLLTKTQQRDTLRALQAHVPIGFGPSGSTSPPATMPTLGTHDLIRQLLLAGQDVEGIARTCGIRVDAARTALSEVAAHPDAGEPLASVLRLIADGRSRAETARELGISQEELSAALDALRSSPLQHKVTHAFTGSATARALVGAPGAEMVCAGALGSGAQQMVPVRFPEAQHQRLKDWCSTHGFSMAVVVRGLVERFLDEQERRAA